MLAESGFVEFFFQGTRHIQEGNSPVEPFHISQGEESSQFQEENPPAEHFMTYRGKNQSKLKEKIPLWSVS